MKNVFICLVISLLFDGAILAQSSVNRFLKPSDTLNSKRVKSIMISELGVAVLSLAGLNQLWYAEFERSSFRTIDDGEEWMRIDKLGHIFSAYQISRLGAESLAWSGAKRKDQLIYGSALSLGFLSTVEIFDGFSSEWGFSWHDFGANVLGSGLYVSQELIWQDQRIIPKYSFHRSDLARINPGKLGDGLVEEIFKDYNAHTYWMSFNLRSFFNAEVIPKWLNLAIGYGGNGMLTGTVSDPEGVFDSQDRYVQYYLGLDLDLSRIRTHSHILRTIFSLFNTIKVPLPTLEFSRRKNPRFYLLY